VNVVTSSLPTRYELAAMRGSINLAERSKKAIECAEQKVVRIKSTSNMRGRTRDEKEKLLFL
jgi:hypothetical protein